MEQHQTTTLRELYPHFTDDQLEEAEANLERYLAVMMRIAERLRSDGYDLASTDLTHSQTNASIPDVKVEQPTQDN
jgi:hypothetical protein